MMKYCIATPMRLETIQYRDRPIWKLKAKTPSMMGIIYSIMVWLDCCRGSMDGVVVIFC